MKRASMLLLWASTICSLTLLTVSLYGAYDLYSFRHGYIPPEVLKLIGQQPIHAVSPDKNLSEGIHVMDFQGGTVVHVHFPGLTLIPISLLGIAYLLDRPSLKTVAGKIAVCSGTLFYLTSCAILLWIWSWNH